MNEMKPLKTFSEILKVLFHYARWKPMEYGTIGKSYTFRVDEIFYLLLEKFIADLSRICPLGIPNVITSAGAYVAEPVSLHTEGLAIDIDAIFWDDFEFVTLNYSQYPRFYLAVEALLRLHFGTVLDFNYDKPHQDHFHIDTSRPVEFSVGSKSKVLFIQHVANTMFGETLKTDWKYGKLSDAAVERMCGKLNVDFGIFNPNTWRELLLEIAKHGFKLFSTHGW